MELWSIWGPLTEAATLPPRVRPPRNQYHLGYNFELGGRSDFIGLLGILSRGSPTAFKYGGFDRVVALSRPASQPARTLYLLTRSHRLSPVQAPRCAYIRYST